MRREGFILVELLIALSICAISMALFTYSSSNRIKMLEMIEEHYASERLNNDILILTKVKELNKIDLQNYSPLRLRFAAEKIEIEYKYSRKTFE